MEEVLDLSFDRLLMMMNITIHGPMNVKFVNAKQSKETHQYRNIKEFHSKINKIDALVHLVAFTIGIHCIV